MAEIQAKVIVLGDGKTGKSELIKNLGFNVKQSLDDTKSDSFFSVAEFPVSELQNSDSSIFLKIWEHSCNMNPREEQLAFKGSLICIITVDVRDENSANNAFNKWLSVKEKSMGEAFLFVVGTFLDQSLQRRVEIDKICKACAQKDAIYVEISNTTRFNVNLLNHLIAQRLNYMIHLRNVIGSQPIGLSSSSVKGGTVADQYGAPDGSGSGEAKFDSGALQFEVSEGDRVLLDPSTLSIPVLEKNVMGDSIGSILSSYLGIDSWAGFEAEEQQLRSIGCRVNDFVDLLVADEGKRRLLGSDKGLISEDTASLVHGFGSMGNGGDGVGAAADAAGKLFHLPSTGSSDVNITNGGDSSAVIDESYDMEGLEDAYSILGLSLPSHIKEMLRSERDEDTAAAEAAAAVEQAAAAAESAGPPSPTRPTAPYLRKMVVRMLDGSITDMILDLEGNTGQQIDLFLLSHSLGENEEVKTKLMSFVARVQREYDVSRGKKPGVWVPGEAVPPPPPPPPSRPLSGGGELASGGVTAGVAGRAKDATGEAARPPPPPPQKSNVSSRTPAVCNIESAPPPQLVSSSSRVNTSLSKESSDISMRSFKLRISLPSGAASNSEAESLTATVHRGDSLCSVCDSLMAKYRLTPSLKNTMMVQLNAAAGIQ